MEGYIPFNHPEEINDDTKDYYPNTFFDCYFEWKSSWESEKNMVSGATPGTLEADDWQPDAQADFEGLYAIEYAFDIAEYLEINFACAGVCK